jgi:phosphoglucomutase
MGQSLAACLDKKALTMIDCSLEVATVPTKPIEGQKPGTSGLRKKTKVFMGENYLANFVQSVFDALADTGTPVKGGTLVISGDGRYFNTKAAQIVAKIAYGNGVKTVWFGVNALLSTPAVSAVIRSRGAGFVPFGGFILSASHNPGGPDEDFGIKYNCENGGPAPEKVTDAVHAHTGKIERILQCNDIPDIDLSTPATYTFGTMENHVEAVVFDSAETHEAVLRDCFDFAAIKSLIARDDFTFVYDSMSGVQGPYAKRILVESLGGKPSNLLNAEPMEDFGGPSSPHHGHADPNLTYAKGLVAKMGLNARGEKLDVDPASVPDFGAAADGDADRNMILGKQFFVSPSDSLAMICANADVIPYFARDGGLKGVARSMPTSLAVDLVAKEKGIPCFETPTGWKYFGNLMDSGDEKYFPGKQKYTPFLCGEESFGTGSDHVREKDGMWAVLAWLQILAAKNPDPSKKLVTVEDIACEHWKKYGRNYYARYDYEGVDKAQAEKMMANMREKLSSTAELGGEAVSLADDFKYVDPVDGSTTTKQGIRVLFKSGSRFVFRLSGTGVEGATIRLYLEKYEPPSGNLEAFVLDVVKPLGLLALSFSDLEKLTGRKEPSVIT